MCDIILLNSQDATLSPAMFMLCPLEAGASRLWFINLWNLQLGKEWRMSIFIWKNLTNLDLLARGGEECSAEVHFLVGLKWD